MHSLTSGNNVIQNKGREFFAGRGKRSAWDTWKVYDDVTPALCSLIANPESIESVMKPLERFVVLIYDRTSSLQCINQVRKQLFTQKGRAIEGLPPTKAALIQHTKRAAYQAGYSWAQVMIPDPKIPSPSEWDWKSKESGGWEICWTTLPEATKVCRELLRCGCKKGCKKQCNCLKAALQCTALCHCGGLCTEN